MFQRVIWNRILTSLPRSYRLRHINKFSSDVTKDENNTSKLVNAEVSSTDDFESTCNTEHVSYLLEESTTFKDAKDKSWATTPFPKDVSTKQMGDRPFVNPEDTSVIMFPGQGTIKVGMVNNYMKFPAAKELFEIANEILNYDLLDICLNGPQEKLDRTEFNQAATVVLSLAALEKLREERPTAFDNCMATLGYSVGEITSLILSGVISFEDGIRLVCVRGKAMQYASERVPQGMLSVNCTPSAKIANSCQEAEKWAMEMGVDNPVCRVAIYLCTQRKILAGNIEALRYIESNKREMGLTDVTRLPVSGAFHTPLMEPCLKSVFKMLSSIELDEPRCLVYSNYKTTPYNNLRLVKKYILKQIVSPVKWEQCLQKVYEREPGRTFPMTYDVGSGGRMKTILRMVNAKAWQSCIVI
ncbi:probable malonyl-CoA-acyl carrier protein transacylase, mitochondrial [Hylaeus volcanicus]|uniref:probable malonyl-CoA-acyl carrier protein transacylase, mitochondrial n=1 Tax=Hylaeus volcanicus TaxID=313075 RepID=UPI0023B84808|nr:probable malonyl-CoA-acyl carrier protein transacylase, mitochondrial [Hylaeus volcanicus]